MTDDEYVKRGVELADGWSIDYSDAYGEGFWVTGEVEHLPGTTVPIGCTMYSGWSWVRVLLAAQLVRQVKALSDAGIMATFDYFAILLDLGDGERKATEIEGEDDTMNAIKACVEVLGG